MKGKLRKSKMMLSRSVKQAIANNSIPNALESTNITSSFTFFERIKNKGLSSLKPNFNAILVMKPSVRIAITPMDRLNERLQLKPIASKQNGKPPSKLIAITQ
jgi:hypothetical protein